MSFGKYDRARESDEYSTPGEINQENGTPISREEVSDDKEEDIVETFNSTQDKDA